MRKYLATYKDKRGTETTIIKSDGSTMFLSLRDIDFEGSDFEMLTGEIDSTKFEYENHQNGVEHLTNFRIIITIPIQFYNSISNQSFSENLIASIEVGQSTTIDGLDSEINSLKLKTSIGEEYKVEKKLEWMEDALIALQNQLPENIYLKTCLSCKYSNYSPFGNGMFGSLYCFKNKKEQLVTLNDKTDLLDIWTKEAMDNKEIFSVQETFDCTEHQLPTKDDWYYKSWTKLILKNEEIEEIESTLFYQKMNVLLRNKLSEIKQNITPQYKQTLKERQFHHPLPIICKFEYAVWSGNRQWRLELDFDDYQWSNETMKPHFVNAFITFETTREYIHFRYQLCSSFNEMLLPMEVEKIEKKLLNNIDFVSKQIKKVEHFLDDLPLRFIQEIEKINFTDLEFLEDIEEIYQIIKLHKENDTKQFYIRTQLFILDAIQLMGNYITDYEKIILERAKKMYLQETPLCLDTLKNLRIIVAEKRYSEVDIQKERLHVLNAINGFLTPFEEYDGNDEINRPYELEYKIDDLMQAGLQRKQCIPLIKQHFIEIINEHE